LSKQLSNIEITDALNQIKVILEDKTEEDIKIVDSQLTFNAGFFGFRWNWNIMVPIDGGKIILKSTDNETVLVYTIFMHRLFIVTAVMSVFMGLVSRQIGVGLFSLLGYVEQIGSSECFDTVDSSEASRKRFQ
jgi:hypothetical protein